VTISSADSLSSSTSIISHSLALRGLRRLPTLTVAWLQSYTRLPFQTLHHCSSILDLEVFHVRSNDLTSVNSHTYNHFANIPRYRHSCNLPERHFICATREQTFLDPSCTVPCAIHLRNFLLEVPNGAIGIDELPRSTTNPSASPLVPLRR
jgi:hypothetical protein